MCAFQFHDKHIFVTLSQRCSHGVIAQTCVQIHCFHDRVIYIRSCNGKCVVTGTGLEMYFIDRIIRRGLVTIIGNSAICSQTND